MKPKGPWATSLAWGSFWKYFNIILLFRNYLPSEQDVALHLNKLKSPQPKKALCQVLLKLAGWFWRWFFSIFTIISFYFAIFLSLDKGLALRLNKFESPPPKDHLYQVWLKLADASWNISNIILLLSPLGEGHGPSFEQTWIPST